MCSLAIALCQGIGHLRQFQTRVFARHGDMPVGADPNEWNLKVVASIFLGELGENMIRKLWVVFLSMAAAAVLTGCIDVETLVKVKADGSGTVDEKVLMKKELVSMMKSMGASLGASEEGESDFSLLDREELEQDAQAMGPGVTLVSAEAVSTDKGEGYLARFAFEDINTLRLNQNPGDRAPSEGGTGDGPEAGKKKEPVSFSFTPGDEPLLVIRPPAEEKASEGIDAKKMSDKAGTEETGDAADEAAQAQAMMMMQQMFDGLRVAIHLEVEGEIVETNATYRDGSRVTLMEMDFSKLIQDPERFQAFVKSDPDSLEDSKELMKDLPGAKVDLNEEIVIRFAAK